MRLDKNRQKQRQRLESFREFLRLVEEMAYEIDAAIVEGSHDEKTLRMSGFSKPIVRCSQTKLSHPELVDHVASRFSSVAILTDFDEKGEEINTKLVAHLERLGVVVGKSYRRRLREIFRGLNIRTLESIYGVKLDLFG